MRPDEFYPSEFTDVSRKVAERFISDFPDAILIGGWASWARIGLLKSHDIDVIVGPELLPRIEERYGPLSASTHIGGKEWAAEHGGIHLDIYVPYQSRLGARLRLRVEALTQHAEMVDGWRLLAPPAHLATKCAALLDRPDSEPGEKDRREIWGLLGQGIAPDGFAEILRAAEAAPLDVVAGLRDVFRLLEDMELSRQDRQRARALMATFVEAAERALA